MCEGFYVVGGICCNGFVIVVWVVIVVMKDRRYPRGSQTEECLLIQRNCGDEVVETGFPCLLAAPGRVSTFKSWVPP